MRVLLLVNSESGARQSDAQRARFVENLEARGAKVAVSTPTSAEASRQRAAELDRSDVDVVVVSGGDGTLSVVANGLLEVDRDRRPRLGILPAGRGNDFAAEMGIHGPADTLRSLTEGHSRLVDVGRTESGDAFLGIAGAGFDAACARLARDTPLLSGSVLYSYAVLRTLVSFRPVQAKVTWEQDTYEGPITFAAVGNSRRYGGGMHITPHANLSDGKLDLCLVKDIAPWTLLRMFPKVFSGSHLSHPQVLYAQSASVTIETREPGEIFADGEFLQTTPAELSVLPGELDVFCLR